MIPWGRTMWSVKAKQKFWNVPYYSNYHGYEYKKSESEVTQLCPTLCEPMNCSLPGSSVHGILQARILEWVAISFSSRSSQPRDGTWVSHIVGRCFNLWATREAHEYKKHMPYNIYDSSSLKCVFGLSAFLFDNWKVLYRKYKTLPSLLCRLYAFTFPVPLFTQFHPALWSREITSVKSLNQRSPDGRLSQ